MHSRNPFLAEAFLVDFNVYSSLHMEFPSISNVSSNSFTPTQFPILPRFPQIPLCRTSHTKKILAGN